MSFRKPLTIALAALCALSSAPLALAKKAKTAKSNAETPSDQSLAFYLLKQLQEREQAAMQKYETAISEEDVAQIKRELQSVIDGYDKLITDAPDYAPAYIAYGLLLNRTGNREASYAMFLKADELDPMVPVVKNQLGNYMAEEGKYMEAYGFFLMARDLAPQESLYYYQLGNLLLAYRDYFMDEGLFADYQEMDRAIQDNFREAMIYSPSDISLKMRYAQSFFDIEDPDWMAALEIWQELYDQAGSEFEKQMVRLYTARVRYELGHHRAARKLLKQVDHPSLDESKQVVLDSLNAKYPE
ncbi:hypothetical protein [Pelagicoccus sp. SDUM812003]|uniref:hypothetical protein n=1 Tax=Pelagicoccus sp. SDUM812003 TaxID=3041267 RepID=UPI00280D1987|nr:hypothetical protein [Pelagicoccus sp. SDUM812003]MDQ8204099.1 hypothetical protein [Pelagicoccus sp. SDUM812003]